MNGKRVIPVWINVLNILLILGGMVWAVLSFLDEVPQNGPTGSMKIVYALTFITYVVMMLYCAGGYNKESAGFYRVFIALHAVTSLIVAMLTRRASASVACTNIMAFGVVCVLAFASDLGKTKSYILCLLKLFFSISRIIFSLNASIPLTGGNVGDLIFSISLCIMIYAKYADKSARKLMPF